MGNQVQVGRSGELLAAYYLESFGVETSIVHMGATDIIAMVNNNYVRVQVKSREKTDKNRYDFFICKGGKKEPLTIMDCDILALVGLPHKQVFFMHMKEMKIGRHIKKNVNIFNDDELARSTWNRAISFLNYGNASMRSRLSKDVSLPFENIIVAPNVMTT